VGEEGLDEFVDLALEDGAQLVAGNSVSNSLVDKWPRASRRSLHSLLSNAAILRVPEEGPQGPVSKGAENESIIGLELE
jgi:hypothetical protein